MKIFVASSTQGLKVAEAVQVNLEEYADVIIWNQQVFDVSSYLLEALERVAKEVDYGIFVITPDDLRKSATRSGPIPRDNVIFELGMFVGTIGRRRTFLIVPSDIELHLPSDLSGLVQARYRYERIKENSTAALGTACTQIRKAIETLDTTHQSESEKNWSPTAISPEPGSNVSLREVAGSCLHYHGRLVPHYTGEFLQNARKEICILGFSLRSFIGYFDSRPESEIRLPILEALARGVLVSFLFLDPESAAAKVFAKERGDKRLLKEIHETIARAAELKSEFAQTVSHAKLELRAYSQLPFAHLKRVDGSTESGRLLSFPYLPGVRRPDIPYLEVRRRSNPMLFGAYSKALDNVLSSSRILG
jgi:hypothetical protein